MAKSKLLSFAILLALTACASKQKINTGDANHFVFSEREQVELSVEDEKKMTDEVIGEVSKDFPEIKDVFLKKYISDIGQKIILSNNLDKNPYTYTFKLIENESPMAFSLPAGFVYISLGLVAQAGKEKDLAEDLSREIAHVKLKHASTRIYNLRRSNKPWHSVGGGLLGGTMGYGIGKMGDENVIEQKYAFFAHSVKEDAEAGDFAEQLLQVAGYDKKESKAASRKFFDHLKKAQSLLKK